MFLLTITLRGTDHQVVLAYATRETLQKTKDDLAKLEDHPVAVLQDDFGHAAFWQRADVVSMVFSDIEEDWEFRNEKNLAALRAEIAFQHQLERDPTLRPFIGRERTVGKF